MNKIFNVASRVILGLFRTTPIEVLSRESPLIHFLDVLKRKNHLFLIKKITRPDSHPIKRLIQLELAHQETHHPSPTHSILEQQLLEGYNLNNVETIWHHLINPWDNFGLDIRNTNVKKEEAKSKVEDQIEQMTNDHEHMIFTDGSSIPENGTASAAILDQTTSMACRLNDNNKASAFEAEVLAIKLGLDIIIDKFYNTQDPFRHSSKKINFFIDNQATILAVANRPKPTSNQTTFIEIYSNMKMLIEIFDFSIFLYWCPAHVNVAENESVNQLAKEATEGNHLRVHNPKRTLSNIQHVARKNFKMNKEKKPIRRNETRLVTLPFKIFDSLKKLEQSESLVIYQLRSGHTPLNAYLCRIKKNRITRL
jgi:ribonuclease HI